MPPTPTRPSERPPPDDSEDSLEVTLDDIRWIRQQRRQAAHEEWLRGQIKVLWPWVVSVIGAVVAAAVWVRDHVKL